MAYGKKYGNPHGESGHHPMTNKAPKSSVNETRDRYAGPGEGLKANGPGEGPKAKQKPTESY